VLGLTGSTLFLVKAFRQQPLNQLVKIMRVIKNIMVREEYLEEYAQDLRRYYENDFNGKVENIFNNVASLFPKQPANSRALVVFDIDETSLALHELDSLSEQVWTHSAEYDDWRKRGFAPPIKPVLEFYKKLRALGYNIAFITAQAPSEIKWTRKNLIAVGYDEFIGIFGMPKKALSKFTIAPWKKSVRKKLSESYEIVATVGDRDADFFDGYTGKIIKVPNYLYA